MAVWPIKCCGFLFMLTNFAYKTSRFILHGRFGVDLFQFSVHQRIQRYFSYSDDFFWGDNKFGIHGIGPLFCHSDQKLRAVSGPAPPPPAAFPHISTRHFHQLSTYTPFPPTCCWIYYELLPMMAKHAPSGNESLYERPQICQRHLQTGRLTTDLPRPFGCQG
jgi:hypothetical protein